LAVEQHSTTAMNDLIYLGLTVACFILCGLYARGCETL
jgi:hypothetical protein